MKTTFSLGGAKSLPGVRFGAMLIGLALVFVAGCTSPAESNRAAGRAPRIPPQPTLAGDATWFDGAVASHVTLVSAQNPDVAGGTGAAAGAAPGGRGGGGGGGHHRGGGRGGPPPDMAGAPGGGGGGVARPPAVAPPRQVLHVAFTNHSGESIELAVADVTSLLGNFAVRPERLALAPGQTAELEPMFGNYSENLDELDVVVRVRRNGKTETQTLRLNLAPPSTQPAPAPAPTSASSPLPATSAGPSR